MYGGMGNVKEFVSSKTTTKLQNLFKKDNQDERRFNIEILNNGNGQKSTQKRSWPYALKSSQY